MMTPVRPSILPFENVSQSAFESQSRKLPAIRIMAENHAVYRLKPELQTPKGEEIPRS
jgi:hypothetical protein